MNIALWIIAGFLAAAFGGAGFVKLTQPKEKLATAMPWTTVFSAGMVKTIGALELLAAIGLILPGALRIAPILVPLAALGLVLLMVSAIVFHVRRKEIQMIGGNIVLLILAAVVAWGRFGPYAF
jgi:DoxX-like family